MINGAFPYRSDCPISSIPAIEGSLIEDCTISSVPDAIWALDFNFFPPASEFDFGCYCPVIVTRILPGAEPSFTAEWKSTEPENACNPSLLLTAQGAGGCVQPNPKERNVEYVLEGMGEIALTSETNESGECEYDFFLGIPNNLACPSLKSGKTLINFTSWWSSSWNSSSWHEEGKEPSSEINKGWGQFVPRITFNTDLQGDCEWNIKPSLTWPSISRHLLSSTQSSQSSTQPQWSGGILLPDAAGLGYVVDFSTPAYSINSLNINGGVQFQLQLNIDKTTDYWEPEFYITVKPSAAFVDLAGFQYIGAPIGLVCKTGVDANPCENDVGLSEYVLHYQYNQIPEYLGDRTVVQNTLHAKQFRDHVLLMPATALGTNKWGCEEEININVAPDFTMQIRENTWDISAYTEKQFGPNFEVYWNLITTISSATANDCSCAYKATPSRRWFQEFPDYGVTQHTKFLSSESWSSSTVWRYYSEFDFEYGVLVDFEFTGPEESTYP